MPEVLADQHTDPSKACIESADRISPREKTAFIKETICGQINFMVNVNDLSAGEIGGCDIKAVTGVLVHESNDHVEIAALFKQMLEDRVIICRLVRDRCNQILQHISS